MSRATKDDIDTAAVLYAQARAFMRSYGNDVQWPEGYPSRQDALADLASNTLWTCRDDAGNVLAVLSLLPGPEPTYAYIEGLPWLNDEPYLVMHRIAVGSACHGVGTACMRWVAAQAPNVRADTHALNLPMQRVLERAGFQRRGTIYIEDGTPRIAFHSVR